MTRLIQVLAVNAIVNYCKFLSAIIKMMYHASDHKHLALNIEWLRWWNILLHTSVSEKIAVKQRPRRRSAVG